MTGFKKYPKPVKKAKIKTRKPKKVTVRAARKKVEKLFSIYIRTRDCLKTTGTKTEGKCVTCEKIYPFEALHAGHFVDGRHPSVVFDERNCHAQCFKCNMKLPGCKAGNIIKYYPKMLEMYGQKVIYELEKKDLELKKFTVIELQELFNTYTIKLYEFE